MTQTQPDFRPARPAMSAGQAIGQAVGQAQSVLARTPALAPVVHRAFANGLDLAYVVAGGFGLLATVLVFTLVRQRPQAAAAGAGTETRAAEPAEAAVEA